MRAARTEPDPAAAGGLPYIDEHTLVVDAPVDVVWAQLTAYTGRVLCRRERGVVDRVLGTAAAGGFVVAESQPPTRLVLAGRHRFSRYAIDVALAGEGARTRISARSYAHFPGLHGRLYRLAVVRSGAHGVVTRRPLRASASTL